MLNRATLLVLVALLASCTSFKLGVANLPARFGDYQRIADLPYGTGPRQSLDVYQPEGAHGAPVIVFWYGGGFENGDRAKFRFVGAALAGRGLVAVLPDYRVYPPSVFPDFLDDAALAVKWARDHAAEYGGDPQRVFLMGHSAGGYLATMVALDRRYLEKAGAGDLRVRGFIALSAPHVLAPNTTVLHTIFGPPWTPANWQPVSFATAAAPPALLMHGAGDTLVEAAQSEALARTLEARGAQVTLRIFPGLSHEATIAALSLPLRRQAPVLDETVAFVQRWSAN